VRYLMTVNGGGPPPDRELYDKMGELIQELSRAGIVVATGGLAMEGTRMSARGGKVTMTDGPYAETKETIVSFALIDVASPEELRPLVERFWAIVGEGEGDIRQVYGS
jgi:hypothetical protein